MADSIKCPKCKSTVPKKPICAECGFDMKAYYSKATIACPKCKTTVPKKPICAKCGFDIKAHYLKKQKPETPPTPPPAKVPAPEATPETAPAPDVSSKIAPVGDLFSRSFDVFKQRWLTLIVLNLLVGVAGVVLFAVPFLLGLLIGSFSGDLKGIVAGVFFFIAMVLSIIGASWVMAAFIAAVVDRSLGIKAALGRGWGRVWSYIWMVSLAWIAISGGYVLFIVPGVLFTVWAFPAMFVLFAEEERGMKVLLKSREYVRGYFGNTFLKLLVIMLVFGVVSAVPFGALVAYPIMMIFMHQMYLNLKDVKGSVVIYPTSFFAKFKWIGTGLIGLMLPVALVAVLALTVGKGAVSQAMRAIKSGPSALVAEGPAVTVYQHCDYEGYSVPLKMGKYTLSDLQNKGVVNDDLSSIKVPDGLKVLAFEHDNFGGRYWELSGDDRCFVDRGLNDVVSSVWVDKGSRAVTSRAGGAIKSAPSAPVAEGPSVTVYQHCDYGGYSVPLQVGTYTLSDLQNKGVVNDDLSSIKVPDGLKVLAFEHDNFGGSSWEFSGDDRCFVDRGLNDVVSSVRVEKGGRAVTSPGSFSGESAAYLGCFTDTGDPHSLDGRDMSGIWLKDSSMTIEQCVSYCGSKGYKYAGLQYSRQCFCDNDYGAFGPSDNCNMECSGNASQICGGTWANSVYSIGQASQSGGGEGGAKSGATGDAIIVLDGDSKLYELKTGFISKTRFADPGKAQVHFMIQGKDKFGSGENIIMVLDATKTGTHYVDGPAVQEGFMGGGRIKVGNLGSKGYEAKLEWGAYGGQVFFPKGDCYINVSNAYTGGAGSVFSGSVSDCTVHSAGIDKHISSFDFTIRGQPES
jgi:hypothetical protein